MGVLQLLDADETTVLFDFHDPTGAASPGTVSTKLGADIRTVQELLGHAWVTTT